MYLARTGRYYCQQRLQHAFEDKCIKQVSHTHRNRQHEAYLWHGTTITTKMLLLLPSLLLLLILILLSVVSIITNSLLLVSITSVSSNQANALSVTLQDWKINYYSEIITGQQFQSTNGISCNHHNRDIIGKKNHNVSSHIYL